MSSPASEPLAESLPGNLPTEIFFDTSIFCARLKDDRLRDRVDETAEHFAFRGTSTYVLLEYGNVILKEVTYFRNKLLAGMTLTDLVYRVSHQLPQAFHSNKVKWFFTLLLRYFNSPDAEERAKLALEEILAVGTHELRHHVDGVRDQIDCPWVEQSGDWKTPHGCQHRADRCRLDGFFRDNREAFAKIRTACDAAVADGKDHTKQLARFSSLISRAQANPSILCDYMVCKQLGDALIAVQSEKYRCFFTQNFYDSRVLCPVMGQLLLELGQDLTDPVQSRDFRPSATFP